MTKAKLKRTIGFISATSIGLGAMLGAGIFVFPGLAGGQAGFAAIISFLIGGFIALAVSACTAELATAMPTSGGGYVFVSRTFGNFWGTFMGIAQWIGLVFACAFYLASFGEYALSILEQMNISWEGNARVFSFVFTLMLLAINILGTKKVGRLQNIMVISLTIILVLMFTYGLIDYLGIEQEKVAFTEVAPNGLQSIFSTTALIFTAYLGFVQIANIGAEIKNPTKNLPRSLIWSVVIAMSLYAFIMFACIVTYPQAELGKFGEKATIEVARKMLGNTGALIVLFGGVLAALSSANASMISASRSVYAISRDNLISQKASEINERFGTPHIALIATSLLIAVVLIRSKIEIFAEVASFLHLIIYAGICFSVLKLRVSAPKWYFPTFRVPFVNIIAGLGAVSCIGLLFFMQKLSILISLAILLLIVLYYVAYVKRKEVDLSIPEPPHVDLKLIDPDILIPVNVKEEIKDLPAGILKSIPRSKLLLLGYKEMPEQAESEQLGKNMEEKGEEKFERIKAQMEQSNFEFESKLMVGNNISLQIKQLVDEHAFQLIISLTSPSSFNRIIVPIYEPTQINTKLSTFIHKLETENEVKTKIIFFKEKGEGENNASSLRKNLTDLLSAVDVRVKDHEVEEIEDLSYKAIIQNLSKRAHSEDLIICSEGDEHEREDFVDYTFIKESERISSPLIMLLNKSSDQTS